MRTIALSLVVALCGCGGEAPSTVQVSAVDSVVPPVLSFNADFSETQSGPLAAGQPAILHYDPARLPACRGVYEGVPAWAIQGSFAADGGFATNVTMVAPSRAGFLVGVDVPITVPFGRDLAVWFLNSDELGCSAWDSDYGRNYHFAIGPASEPTIHFHSDFTTTVEGTIHAGAPLVVDYDLARLPSCRQDYNGLPSWDVTVYYRFDCGPIAQASLTKLESEYSRVAAPATLAVPAGAYSIEMWFESTDRTGCQSWDSDYARNYLFIAG